MILPLLFWTSALAQVPLGSFSPDLTAARAVLQLADGRVLFSVGDDLEVFSPDGTRLGVFAEGVGRTPCLAQTADGRVLGVFDRERVEAFAPDGTALGPLVSGLTEAHGIAALRDGRIAVATWFGGGGGTGLIRIVSSEGVPLDTLRDDTSLFAPTQLTQLNDGRLVVSRLSSESLLLFSEDGTSLGEIARRVVDGGGQAVQHPDRRLFVTDNGLFTSAVRAFGEDLSRSGPFVDGELGLLDPYGLEILDDGRVVVLDGVVSGRVLVYGGAFETPPDQPFLAADLADYGSSDALPRAAFNGDVYVEVGGEDSNGGVLSDVMAYDLGTGDIRVAEEIGGPMRQGPFYDFHIVGGQLLFLARDMTRGGRIARFAYDPSTGETRPVSNEQDITRSYVGAELDGRFVYPFRDTDHVERLYAYNPSNGDVERLATFAGPPLGQFDTPAVLAGRYYFSYRFSLNVFDPVTGRVTQLEPGLDPTDLTALGDRLYFRGDYDGRPTLMVYDPETFFATRVADGLSYPSGLTAFEGRLYFSRNGQDLYAYDPVTDDIRVVGTLPPVPPFGSSIWEITSAGGALYFVATGDAGSEIYRYDTTAEEIRLAADVGNGHSSDPRGLLAVGDDLYFGAAGVPNDRELYRIDAVSTTVEPVPSSASVTVS
ncbi:MAG: hypothetical protein AAF791_05795, partial [Bacteroidota bacterium]